MAMDTLGFSPSDSGAKGGILSIPPVTKEPRQRSISSEDIFFTRFISPWSRPLSLNADGWRWWVFNESIAMICRETLIASLLALDWAIIPRESSQRDELAATIRHYTRLFEQGGEYYGFDYTGLIEWVMADLLDLPFGSGMEIGHKNDSPTGRVIWMKPLDGGTLFPTLNKDYPVVQYYQSYNVVKFPAHAIARTYMSPRPEILREGWGLAPPEKIVLALEMLLRGDKYYANLLMDTPPAGILDLGDMEKDSALEWVSAFKSFMQGSPIDAFRIPVLYEHTTDTEFIPFGKVPNDLMYDRITLKYAAIVAAAYGMSLGDIGLQATAASGQTLAGSIRDERKTKRTGFARAKKKLQYLFDKILPDALQFKFIDLDDEVNVALGRARLANATAQKIWIENRMFSPTEMRLQTLEDGIVSVNIPEKPPADSEFPDVGQSQDRPGLLGYPSPPSSGGEGEVKKAVTVSVKRSKYFDKQVTKFVGDMTNSIVPVFVDSVKGLSEDELYLIRSTIDSSLFGPEDLLELSAIIEASWKGKKWLKLAVGDVGEELRSFLTSDIEEYLEVEEILAERATEIKSKLSSLDFGEIGEAFEKSISNSVKNFVGRSVIYLLKDMLINENMLDDMASVSYDSIIEQVGNKLIENFDEFSSAAVNLEAESIIRKIKEEVLK